MDFDKILKDVDNKIAEIYAISDIIMTVSDAVNYCIDEDKNCSHVSTLLIILNDKINSLRIDMENLSDEVFSLKYGIVR